MFIDLFVKILFYVLAALVALLPVVSVNSTLSVAVAGFAGQMSLWNGIIPLSTIYAALGVIIVIELAVLVYRIVDKIRHFIPGQG